MMPKVCAVFCFLITAATIVTAATKEEVVQYIQSIDNELVNLISISNRIKNLTEFEPTISELSQNIQHSLQTKVDVVLDQISSIKIEVVQSNYNVPDLQLEEAKIKIIPEAYTSRFIENARTAIINKTLEIEGVVDSFSIVTANLKIALNSCQNDADLSAVSDAAEKELENIIKAKENAEKYSSEIATYLVDEQKNQESIGEKELGNFSLQLRTLIFQEPINIYIEPLRKNISDVKSEIDKVINRYTINLLFNYSRPIDEALITITIKLNQYKSSLSIKNSTLISENAAITEIQNCLKNIEKFDEILAENVTNLRNELKLCASTFNRKINLNSAKLKQVGPRVQRFLTKLEVLDFNSLDDLEITKDDCLTNLEKFLVDFAGYNTFKEDLEDYKKEFTSIMESNNFMEEADEIYKSAVSCLDDISAAVSLGSYTLLVVSLIALCNSNIL